jgi:ligand-binding SRPBCC domain-containing protein
MPVLELTTIIRAPIEICFDLARSIDLHQTSMVNSRERAIGGVTSGLIGNQQEVTWEATHFGFKQQLTSRITDFDYPRYFRDEMVKGAFKMIKHDHSFEAIHGATHMYDRFEYESPGGMIGKAVNKLILTSYLKNLIIKRNTIIKEYAETEKWKLILK